MLLLGFGLKFRENSRAWHNGLDGRGLGWLGVQAAHLAKGGHRLNELGKVKICLASRLHEDLDCTTDTI